MLAREKLVGVVPGLNPLGTSRFIPEDLELVATSCQQVAVAVQDAHPHKALRAHQREQQQFELATMVQQKGA